MTELTKRLSSIDEVNNELFTNSCEMIECYFKQLDFDGDNAINKPTSYDEWVELVLDLAKYHYCTPFSIDTNEGICVSIGNTYFTFDVNFMFSIHLFVSFDLDTKNIVYDLSILFFNELDFIKESYEYTQLVDNGWIPSDSIEEENTDVIASDNQNEEEVEEKSESINENHDIKKCRGGERKPFFVDMM